MVFLLVAQFQSKNTELERKYKLHLTWDAVHFLNKTNEPGGNHVGCKAFWIRGKDRRERALSNCCGLTMSPKFTGWRQNPQPGGKAQGCWVTELCPPCGLLMFSQHWTSSWESIIIKVSSDSSCSPVLPFSCGPFNDRKRRPLPNVGPLTLNSPTSRT